MYFDGLTKGFDILLRESFRRLKVNEVQERFRTIILKLKFVKLPILYRRVTPKSHVKRTTTNNR